MDLRSELSAFYYSTALCDLRLMNQKCVDRSITYNSLLYLELIYSMDGRCTASRLAELLCVSRSAVTMKVNELVEQGLIVKTTDPSDRRRSFLAVNEEAVPQYRVYRQQDDLAVRTISSRFTPEDIEKFCRMLRIMTDINFKDPEEGDSYGR